MNKQEMASIFALFMLVYPKADVFKGTDEEIEAKLETTITLWADLFRDADYIICLAAAKRLLLKNRWMPVPAELAAEILDIHKKLQYGGEASWVAICKEAGIGDSVVMEVRLLPPPLPQIDNSRYWY